MTSEKCGSSVLLLFLLVVSFHALVYSRFSLLRIVISWAVADENKNKIDFAQCGNNKRNDVLGLSFVRYGSDGVRLMLL